MFTRHTSSGRKRVFWNVVKKLISVKFQFKHYYVHNLWFPYLYKTVSMQKYLTNYSAV